MKSLHWICVPILANLLFSTVDASLIITTDTVQDGGTLTINPADEIVIHGPTNPMLTMTNGATSSGVKSFLVGAATEGNGQLRIESGSSLTTIAGSGTVGTYGGVNALGTEGYVGFNQDTTGNATVIGSNSTLRTVGPLYIGHYGQGTLTIHDQGRVESTSTFVGFGATGNGQVSMDTGTWSPGNLTIASNGIGSVSVSQATVNVGNCVVGVTPDAEGSVTLTGPDAYWRMSDFTNGSNGNGLFRVENGATLETTTNNVLMGKFLGGFGEVRLTGTDSTWNAQKMKIGVAGLGRLSVEDGARFSTVTDAILGDSNGGGGTMMIDGIGSSVDIGGNFHVGMNGVGSLYVEDGAILNTNAAEVANHFNAVGNVRINGFSSRWNINGSLTVGDGNLQVRGGGTLAVAGDIEMNNIHGVLLIYKSNLVDEAGSDLGRISGLGMMDIQRYSNVGFKSIDLYDVVVSGGSVLRITPGGGTDGTSRIKYIGVTGDSFFDMTDHALVIGSPSQLMVRPYLKSGCNNGSWDGTNGIGSSLAHNNGCGIGYARSSELGSPATFMGLNVISSDYLLRYTLLGDANLNGTVTFLDLLQMAQNYGSTAGGKWITGDFNYDDQVNFSDLLLVAQNYGLTLLEDGSITIDQSIQSRFQSDWQLALASVPEPATLALLALTPILAARRKR